MKKNALVIPDTTPTPEEIRQLLADLVNKVQDAQVLARVWLILERQYAKE